MLKCLMRRVRLFSCCLILTTLSSPVYGMEFSKLNKMYTFRYVRGTPLPLRRLGMLNKQFKREQLSHRLIWGKLVIQTLSFIDVPKKSKNMPPHIKPFIKELELLYKDIQTLKLDSPAYELFFAGEFVFDLVCLKNKYKFKPSKNTLMLYSTDMFRKVIFQDPKSQQSKRARVMLSIIKISAADITSEQWNAYILDQLSDYNIDSLTNKRIKYQAYLYRAIMCRKIGYAKEAQYSLDAAKEIFPTGRLLFNLEKNWKEGKEGFNACR